MKSTLLTPAKADMAARCIRAKTDITPRQDDEPYRRLPAELSALLRALVVLSLAAHRIARTEPFETTPWRQ